MIDKIKAKDTVIGYPPPENTGSPMIDGIFNWVVGRYQKNKHEWKRSDQTVWKGFLYGVVPYFGYLIFFSLMMWVLMWMHDKYGPAKAVLLALVIIMVRLNIMIKQLASLNKKFQ